MTIAKIALGLIGLGIVVFVHELGHFLAARLVGIDVEAFSIGWGSPILKKKIGAVEYRLGMFPVGGYCKMRGADDIKGMLDNSTSGSFYGASPWRRIVVCLAGPLFNLLFAVMVLSVIWGIGFEVQTLESRIILASEVNTDNTFPADRAGLRTGDRIIEVDGKRTEFFHEVQETIILNPDRPLPITIDREGEMLSMLVTPDLDRSSGAGRIGVFFWNDPVIGHIVPDSDAAIAGLLPGDRIISINDQAITHTIDFMRAMEGHAIVTVGYERDGVTQTVDIIQSDSSGLGIQWETVTFRTPALSPPAALAKGALESWKTLTISLKSLGLLFRGVELTEAVSGPVRITYMVGNVAAEAFGQSIGRGLRSLADFLALISIALCIMNLLPLPVLDGGQIVLFTVEIIRRKPLSPRVIGVFQTTGIVIIAGLMLFALFGDIMFLSRR